MFDFTGTEEHRTIRQTAREFGERHVLPNIRELDEKAETIPGLLPKLGQAGLLGMCIPEQYGGLGLDYMTLAIASEELEYADTAARVVLSVHVGLNSLGLLQWGSEEQKQKYLKPQAKGTRFATFCLTEPGAGSDAANIAATARKDGDQYIVNGEKMWISLADVADHYLLFAKTDPEAGHRGMTAFIIERAWDGVEPGHLEGKLGVRAGSTGSVALTDVKVPAENRVGEEGEGFKIAMSCLDNGRFTVAAGAVGLIRACLDASVKYCHERETFGRSIGQHQLVQQMIARMIANRDIGELLVQRAGWLKNVGKRSTRETALAKWINTVNALQAADDAIEIHGAYGYSNEFPVERFWRNARGAVIYEGTKEIQQIIQAQYALGYRQDKDVRCPLPGHRG